MAGLLEYTKNGQVTEPPLYRFMRGNVQSFLNSIPDPSQMTPEQQLSLGANVNPIMGLLGTTAYHGSPAIFDKFDLNKVGTGEGMQSYGKGIYFSESPSVASKYMNSNDKFITTVNNEVVDTPILKSIIRMGGNPESLVKSLENNLASKQKALSLASKEEVLPGISDYDIAKIDYDSILNKINEAKSYAGKTIENRPAGNLYKVDIPDNYIPKMLDYDKPFSEQPKVVQQAFKKIAKEDPTLPLNFLIKGNAMGGSILQGIPLNQTNELLGKYGVKGVKYIDSTYGTVAKNPTNYVVFDPTEVKILERNNKGLLK
jgi:hypothetical protein